MEQITMFKLVRRRHTVRLVNSLKITDEMLKSCKPGPLPNSKPADFSPTSLSSPASKRLAAQQQQTTTSPNNYNTNINRHLSSANTPDNLNTAISGQNSSTTPGHGKPNINANKAVNGGGDGDTNGALAIKKEEIEGEEDLQGPEHFKAPHVGRKPSAKTASRLNGIAEWEAPILDTSTIPLALFTSQPRSDDPSIVAAAAASGGGVGNGTAPADISPPLTGMPPPLDVGFDPTALLHHEFKRLRDPKLNPMLMRKMDVAGRVAKTYMPIHTGGGIVKTPGFKYRDDTSCDDGSGNNGGSSSTNTSINVVPSCDDDGLPFGRAISTVRKLRLMSFQEKFREEVEKFGREIAELPDKKYKQMLKEHRNKRIDLVKKELDTRATKGAVRANDAKSYKEGLTKLAKEVGDSRNSRNRNITRAHDRLLREVNRSKLDEKQMRMDALKAHDFEAYKEMLRKQAGGSLTAGERFEAIEKFLADTEEYLHKLAGKIASVKLSAEMSTAAANAIAAARAAGLSEEEAQERARVAANEAVAVKAAAAAAAGDGAAGHVIDADDDEEGDAQARYYALAHSTQETINEQPSLLRPPGDAKLREYQLVGLQWMVSLYNNHLNGILADEMGLGKTVQVMALIAYLMEKKSNFGPHLIIVPNAVIVNWKSELTQWLPTVRCVYYVGNKEERARKYSQEVQSLQFNVLVTTYEFIMRDRSRLSKVDWQYIIIDEAQRMKDRQSKLAKDLDRFTSARRLLLSGTPLQNDLQELWSLLNLLLPDVFDDKSAFTEWFGEAIASTSQGVGGGEDWLEKEKRVVVIHRLHQILEPFMLRRQVEDVESKLPPKVALTVKVSPTPYQSAIYDWVRATGTLRLDPATQFGGRAGRVYASLNNKCMELRKICNHPLLSYPPPTYAIGDAIVRQCGKFIALDRIMVKLKAAGHKVLLFSTMTKLLDLLEVYLQWRELPASTGGGRLKYLRIDGSTALEDREHAIQKFNAKDSDTFVFLLSIRAAGRGLNLQSADTVIVYDPDPNPKNEEQAIARSHRIGQTREVRVIHFESVAEPPPGSIVAASNTSNAQPAAPVTVALGGSVDVGAAAALARSSKQQQQQLGEGGEGDSNKGPSPLLGQNQEYRKMWSDSIESLVRNQIQRIKIEMANEIIDAGRFDQQTTNEERRQTLETLLTDQEKSTRPQNVVPTFDDLNRALARTPEELELFTRLDAEDGTWFTPTELQEGPRWVMWTGDEAREAAQTSQKVHKPDMQAELAALTGTVVHHHPFPTAAAAGVAPAHGKDGRPPLPPPGAAAKTTAAVAQQQYVGEVPAAAAVKQRQPVVIAPAVTTTTTGAAASTKSGGGAESIEGAEEEEVDMEDNDEEEEILEQNIIVIDNEDGAIPRVASTLDNGEGDDEAAPPPSKRARQDEGDGEDGVVGNGARLMCVE
jgi:SWI/SNF-related matrix-associated actin-dependent regulator of chromatin subfamily A protein 2/4